MTIVKELLFNEPFSFTGRAKLAKMLTEVAAQVNVLTVAVAELQTQYAAHLDNATAHNSADETNVLEEDVVAGEVSNPEEY
jgi:hypothetical protein